MSDDEFRQAVLAKLDQLDQKLDELQIVHEQAIKRHRERLESFLESEKERWTACVRSMFQEMEDDEADDWWKEGREPPL